MTNDIEHIYVCLLILHIAFLDKCLVKSFSHLLKGYFFLIIIIVVLLLLLSCKSSLYIFTTKPLSDI